MMPVPNEYREIRFRTFPELIEAIVGKDVWETPAGFVDVIGGMKIFSVRDVNGDLTGEMAVCVKDRVEGT